MVSGISDINQNYFYINSANNKINTSKSSDINSKVNTELEKMQEAYETTMFTFRKGSTKISNTVEFQMLAQFNALGNISDNPNETAQAYSNFKNSYNWNDEWQKYLVEWDKYLHSRGCNNEEELAILDGTIWNTMDQLENYAMSSLSYVMTNLTRRIPEMGSSLHIGSNIVNNVSLEALAEYSNSANSTIEKTIIATQNLLGKVDTENSGLSKDYLDELTQSLDYLIELMEEEKQGGQVDFEEYHEQYLDRMLGRYNK